MQMFCFLQLLSMDGQCPNFVAKRDYFMNHDPEVLQLKKDNEVCSNLHVDN